MKVFLATFGSYGDVRPFLWMGRELMAGGHDVMLITNPAFRSDVEGAGLPFHAAGTEEDYRAAARPAVRTGSPIGDQKERIAAGRRLFTRLFLNPSRDTYDAITANLDGDAAVVGHFFAFGARLAAERHGLPWVNVCLAPHWLKGFVKPEGVGPRLQRFAAAANTRFIDGQLFTAPFNALRAEIGLGPMGTTSSRWMFGGGNLCLFPRWFLDFPLEDGMRADFAGFPPAGRGEPLPEALQAFLDKHGRPVVFTAGSSITDGAGFFRAALEALNKLGLPGIFLTRADGCVPENLPDTVLHAGFAPMGSLLGRSAAVVHHGGVGTAAAALECGVPQLVCCRTAEQRENARILKKLGVGEPLPWQKMNGEAMARLLSRLLGDRAFGANCAAVAGKGLNPPPGFLQEYIEKLRQK